MIHARARHLGVGPLEELGAQFAVGHFEDRVVKAHFLGEPTPHLARWPALARRIDRFLVVGEIQVPPGPHHVLGFAGHRGWQHEVGIFRRVGEEVLGHDREQVFALEARHDLVGLGGLADGVGAVDEQALNRRVEGHLARQGRTELEVVHDAGAGADPIGARVLCKVDRELPDRHLEQAAANVPPRADEGWKCTDRADGLGATSAPFQRDADANDGGLGGRELAGKRYDVGCLYARDGFDEGWRELGGARFQLLKAVGVFIHVVLIDEALFDDRINDAHDERAIGAGLGADVPVGSFRGAGLEAVDDDDLRAALLGFEHERPVMQVGRDGVTGPDHNELRVDEAFGIDPARRANGQQPSGRRARGAEGLFVDRGAEAIEERVARVDALHEAHVAQIAVGHDGLRAMLGDDLAPFQADFGDGFVPSDTFELAGAFGARAAQRIEQAIGVGVMGCEVFQLHAEAAPRERVIFLAPHLDKATAAHVIVHGAGVGAIVGAGAVERLGGEGFVHGLIPVRALHYGAATRLHGGVAMAT